MAVRREVIAFGIVTACAAVYLLTSFASRSRNIMTTAAASPTEQKASIDDLIVSLAEEEPKKPSRVKVTVENKNQKYPFTFLKWDSPFDPTSLNSGVFTIFDAETGEKLPSPGLRVSRMLPPSRDDLIEVPLRGSVSEMMELRAPWIPSDGRSVKIQVQGDWKAVWPKKKADIGDEELQAMAGEGVLKGSYQGEQVLELQL